MSDPLRKVNRGDPAGRFLEAETFNMFIDVAKAHQNHAGFGPGLPITQGDIAPNRLEVWVKATTTIPEWGLWVWAIR